MRLRSLAGKRSFIIFVACVTMALIAAAGCGDKGAELSVSGHKVTVIGSFAAPSATGAGLYDAGDTVRLDAGAPDGKTFIGWSFQTSGVTFDNSSKATTFFIMPDFDVTVTATFSDEPTVPTYKVTIESSGGLLRKLGWFSSNKPSQILRRLLKKSCYRRCP